MKMEFDVTFNVTDGQPPKKTETNGVNGLVSPIPLDLAPNSSRVLNLGISCSAPLLLFPTNSLVRRGIEVVVPVVLDANNEITVQITNRSRETQLIEVGDIIVKVFPLLAPALITDFQ